MLILPLLFSVLVGPGSPRPAQIVPPKTGRELLQQMHDHYVGRWYRTITFTQKTTRPTPDGQPQVQTWYEAGSIPGKLRIDIAPIDSGRALLFIGPTRFTFRDGKLVNSGPDRNLLITLGFDVYAQPVEETAKQLSDEGFDLGPIRETTWQGRPVYVVGAAEGDTTANQFWVDEERLLMVRMIQRLANPRNPQAAPAILDVEFNKYQPLGKGWVAPEVVIRVNGKEVQREEYRDIRADTPLAPELFDTTAYHQPAWIGKGE